jgi:hypothetical protein
MKNESVFWSVISWMFVVIVVAIGLVNVFWGNDPNFGVFICLLALVFVPQVNTLFKKITGIRIHFVIKILLGLFILWAVLGVGELFDKTDMMLQSF